MKVKLIIISIILLLVIVFATGCIPVLEKLGLVSPANEEQLSPEKGGPPDGLVKVLIGFKEKPGAAQQAMVRGVGGKIKYTYHIVDAIAASIPQKAIDALRKNPNVRYVEPDGLVQALDELGDSWGVERIGAGIVHVAGNKGAGVKVAIIDSGIDYTHPDLNDNYAGGYDFVNDDDDPMDDAGHGTHVAGTVAAEDNGVGVVGVAPAADLYALKALDERGRGYVSDIVAAIQWATDPDDEPETDDSLDIINMSLGGGASEALEEACQAAYDTDVLLVAAAGNSGNPPGKGDNIIYPAAYESVIAVAATDQNDERARWSSTGPAVELAAPGVGIYSTYIGGGYATYSGTSMASPHVAGVVALMIIANVSDIRGQLWSTADDLGASGRDSLYGYGLVDADEAALPTDTTSPAKVTNLTVTTVSCVQLDLAWNANTEEDLDHYNVYRSTTSGGSSSLVASPTTNSYSDVELTALTKYYYVVSAVDVSGNEGVVSDEAFGTTSADNLGPMTSNVVAEPNPTNGATSVTLTADVSDATTGNSNIVAAEYFVDNVEADGDGISMSVSDDAFDTLTEGVTESINVSSWTVDQHTLYVHGKDVAGNWGTIKLVELNVTEESSNTMDVDSINMLLKIAGINVNAIAKVTIVDAIGNPVEGATVSGVWSGETSDSDSGITDVDGKVSLQSDKVKNITNEITFTFTVDDVIKDGWNYDSPADDDKPSESIPYDPDS
ncbi:hypothetical protein ES705_09280 [subsurface metagenome]